MADYTELLVTYMDGQTKKYRIPQIVATQTQLGEMIERARMSPNLMLEADGALILIPFANVRSVEMNPAPQDHPIPGLITGAKSLR